MEGVLGSTGSPRGLESRSWRGSPALGRAACWQGRGQCPHSGPPREALSAPGAGLCGPFHSHSRNRPITPRAETRASGPRPERSLSLQPPLGGVPAVSPSEAGVSFLSPVLFPLVVANSVRLGGDGCHALKYPSLGT